MFGGMRSYKNFSRFGPDIVIGSTGRVMDNLQNNHLDLSKVKTFVIDEAHRMMENNFIDDLDFIHKFLIEHNKIKPQTIMLSATFPSYIQDRISEFCGDNYTFIDLAKDLKNRTPSTVKHFSLNIQREDRPKVLVEILKKYANDTSKKVIVFANTKIGIKELYQFCNLKTSRALHGDMMQYDRINVFRDFRNGKINVLFATDVAARGLDIPNLDLVVQLEPPQDADLYVHRAGRTARAGKDGIVISAWSDEYEKLELMRIEKSAGVKFRKMDFDEEAQTLEETEDIVSFIKNPKNNTNYKAKKSYWNYSSSRNNKSAKKFHNKSHDIEQEMTEDYL